VSIERLQHELERLEKRLKRKQLSDNEHNIKIAKSRVERAENHREFIGQQTDAMLQSYITQCENKQLQLQSQIESLQRQIRFYSDLILNRETITADADAEVSRTSQHLLKLQGKAPSVEVAQQQWEILQRMLNG